MNHVDNPFTNPRILSICTGIGGLERGIKRAIGPIRTVAYAEIEAFICENLLAGMESGLVDPAPIWCNLKTFDARPFRGIVDGITGGYPCQPFSTAGARAGTEDPRHLWPYVECILRTAQPVWGFFENVSGHLSLGFDQVYRSLSAMGYSVEAGIFTAEEVGAPHRRERLFILAVRKDYLAHARFTTDRRVEQRRLPTQTNGRCKYLGNSDSNGNQKGNAHRGSGKSTAGNKREEDQRQRLRTESSPTGTKVAHSDSAGQPQQRHDGKQDEQNNHRTGNTGAELGNYPGINQRYEWKPEQAGCQPNRGPSIEAWPARPGEHQHQWEAPRTIEPGLGVTIDGYNFREDLLRAAGNGVVEQTAELAFLTLLKKHGL